MLRFVLILALLAVATYLVVRVVQDRGIELPGRRPQTRRPSPRRTVAPDDDEDFLRELDKKRLRNPDDPAE